MKTLLSGTANLRRIHHELGLNKLKLNFLDKDIEEKFRNEYFEKSLLSFRISFVTVILLYSSFGYLDYTTSGDLYKQFFVVRYLIVLPVLFSVFLWSFHKYFVKVWQELIAVCFVVGGAGIIYMLLKNPDNIFYYGGMFLIFMAGYFFSKLRFFYAIISGLLIMVIYNLGTILFQAVYGIQYDYLIITNAFYISANIIGMIALYNIELLERIDFHQKHLLIKKQHEIAIINQNLELKIAQRTKLLDKRNKKLKEEINFRREIERKIIIAKEKATESDRLKSAFLANMSHEIRTPMNGILGFADLLKEPNLTGEEQQKYIKIIENSGSRMLNTINDLMDISKIEAGQMDVVISDVDIIELTEFIYNFFKPEADSKGLKLILRDEITGLIVVQSDREKIYAILTNLIKNALKYTSKGNIEIGYFKDNDELMFYVKDTGIGIPQDKQDAIFERFTQNEVKDKNVYEGSGLGLSISKAYVLMLGGRIWVESKVGEGSQFYFTIPCKKIKLELVETKTIKAKSEDQIKNLKILIVEDEETADTLLSILLKDISQETLHAESGTKAVELCRDNPDLDLIMMDIQLLEMNGYEATRKIREFNKEVIIIAQTAYAIAGDKEKAIESGCDDYISKPIIKELLLQKIEKLVRP